MEDDWRWREQGAVCKVGWAPERGLLECSDGRDRRRNAVAARPPLLTCTPRDPFIFGLLSHLWAFESGLSSWIRAVSTVLVDAEATPNTAADGERQSRADDRWMRMIISPRSPFVAATETQSGSPPFSSFPSLSL